MVQPAIVIMVKKLPELENPRYNIVRIRVVNQQDSHKSPFGDRGHLDEGDGRCFDLFSPFSSSENSIRKLKFLLSNYG